MYININTKEYPLSEDDIKNIYSNTSFTVPFVPPDNYSIVLKTDQPNYDSVIEKVIEINPVLDTQGNWVQNWKIESKFLPILDSSGNIVKTIEQQNLEARVVDQELKIEEFIKQAIKKTQEKLDNFAKTRGYDNILSAATYSTSTISKFRQEGQYAVEIRDQTWSKLYDLLRQIQSGVMSIPQNFNDIEALLPTLEWPN